jgi:hypothetical protein
MSKSMLRHSGLSPCAKTHCEGEGPFKNIGHPDR